MASKKITRYASVLARSKNQKVNKRQLHNAAVELGRKGGAVGGPARAEALTDIRRSDIAMHAAATRWNVLCFCSECRPNLDRMLDRNA